MVIGGLKIPKWYSEIEDRLITQWPKETGQKDKHWATRTPVKHRVNSSDPETYSSSSTSRIVQWMISFRGMFLLSFWWLSFCSLFYGIFIYICIIMVLLSVAVTCGKHLIIWRIWEVLANTTSLIIYCSACIKPG